MRIYITQLIYVKPGEEETFLQFEDVAIPAIAKYNGKLLLRIRPNDKVIIENNMEKPYEMHLCAFASQKDFENFMQDEERKQFLHLKEKAIRSAIIIKGEKL